MRGYSDAWTIVHRAKLMQEKYQKSIICGRDGLEYRSREYHFGRTRRLNTKHMTAEDWLIHAFQLNRRHNMGLSVFSARTTDQMPETKEGNSIAPINHPDSPKITQHASGGSKLLGQSTKDLLLQTARDRSNVPRAALV